MSDVKTLKDLLGGNEQLQNWVKAIHFMSIAQTGLLKFVAYVAKLLHCNAMDEIAEGHHIGLNGKCNKCANPNNSCSTRVLKYMNKKNAARGYVIYERNINVHQWCENAWTIAWAFMGDPHSQKDLNEMDLYGFLKFMTNCRQFNTFLENQSICFDVSVFFLYCSVLLFKVCYVLFFLFVILQRHHVYDSYYRPYRYIFCYFFLQIL